LNNAFNEQGFEYGSTQNDASNPDFWAGWATLAWPNDGIDKLNSDKQCVGLKPQAVKEINYKIGSPITILLPKSDPITTYYGDSCNITVRYRSEMVNYASHFIVNTVDYLTDPNYSSIYLEFGPLESRYNYTIRVIKESVGGQHSNNIGYFTIFGNCGRGPETLSFTYKVGSPPLPIEFQKYYGNHRLCQVKVESLQLEPLNAPALGVFMKESSNVSNFIVFTLSNEFLGIATMKVD